MKKDKTYYCKEPNCNNEISYNCWKYGKGRCNLCSAKKAIHKENCQCFCCKAKRGELKGKNHPMFGKCHTKKSKLKNRNSNRNKEHKPHIHTKTTKEKISKANKGNKRPDMIKRMKGKNNPIFRTHYKGNYYKGIWMRSSYEI